MSKRKAESTIIEPLGESHPNLNLFDIPFDVLCLVVRFSTLYLLRLCQCSKSFHKYMMSLNRDDVQSWYKVVMKVHVLLDHIAYKYISHPIMDKRDIQPDVTFLRVGESMFFKHSFSDLPCMTFSTSKPNCLVSTVQEKLTFRVWYDRGRISRQNGPAVTMIGTATMSSDAFEYLTKATKDQHPMVCPAMLEWDDYVLNDNLNRKRGIFRTVKSENPTAEETSQLSRERLIDGTLYKDCIPKSKCNDDIKHAAGEAFTNPDLVTIIWKDSQYLVNDKHHRKDGPATGSKWYWGGNPHRIDGPAIKTPYETRYMRHGVLHREGGPAFITLHSEEYRFNGKLHREDGPALRETAFGGSLEEWRVHGTLHREDGPCRIKIDHSGRITSEWRIKGDLHRLDGPAQKCSDGSFCYFVRGKKHRVGAPAQQSMWKDKKVTFRGWYKDGTPHREEGPAKMTTRSIEFWRHGVPVEYRGVHKISATKKKVNGINTVEAFKFVGRRIEGKERYTGQNDFALIEACTYNPFREHEFHPNKSDHQYWWDKLE